MKRRWFNLETRPSRLFGDKDRDGVANVFDCQPNNRRRQDGNRKIPAQIVQEERRKIQKDEGLTDKESREMHKYVMDHWNDKDD